MQETARTPPLEIILAETDAPYLVPELLHGSVTVNEPADVVEQTVWDNSNRFFGV